MESPRTPSAAGGLAADDEAYTRAEWDSFEDLAAQRHVQLIPDIDVPAHSSSFIRWRPELGLNGGESDMLNLEAAETVELVQKVFDEFVQWFGSPAVHFGAVSAHWNDLVLLDYDERTVYELVKQSFGVPAQTMWTGAVSGLGNGDFMERNAAVAVWTGNAFSGSTAVELGLSRRTQAIESARGKMFSSRPNRLPGSPDFMSANRPRFSRRVGDGTRR